MAFTALTDEQERELSRLTVWHSYFFAGTQ
jgi:hypothetical protein